MKSISLQELNKQYERLEEKPQMGFNTLASNVSYLFMKGIITVSIIGSSTNSFVLRCRYALQQQDISNKVIVKCLMVNTYTLLSSAIELFQTQQEVNSISPVLEGYQSFMFNPQDEVINFIGRKFYKNSIEQIYSINFPNGSLANIEVIRSWISQLLEAVSNLHERGLAHGGIQSQNIFIDEISNEIRLIDFGFGHRETVIQKKKSDKNIAALPMLNEKIEQVQFQDVYSLVIIIYQMTFGFDSSYEIIKSLQSGIFFDEIKQEQYQQENENSQFKHNVIKIMNQVICASNYAHHANVSIFKISDALSRNNPQQTPINSSQQFPGFTSKSQENLVKQVLENQEQVSQSIQQEWLIQILGDENEKRKRQQEQQQEQEQQFQEEIEVEKSKNKVIVKFSNENKKRLNQISKEVMEYEVNLDKQSISNSLNQKQKQKFEIDNQKKEEIAISIEIERPKLNPLSNQDVIINHENQSKEEMNSDTNCRENENQDNPDYPLSNNNTNQNNHHNDTEQPQEEIQKESEKCKVELTNENEEEVYRDSWNLEIISGNSKSQRTNFVDKTDKDNQFFNYFRKKNVNINQISNSTLASSDQNKQLNSTTLPLQQSQISQQTSNQEINQSNNDESKQFISSTLNEMPEADLTNTSNKILDENTGLISQPHDDPSNEIVILFDDNQNKIYEGEMLNNLYHGLGIEYHENGQILHQGTYEEGLLCGLAKSFHQDGVLQYSGSYYKGLCHGEGEKFENGNLTSKGMYQNGKIHGYFKRYYENGQLQFNGNYKNNKREGKALEYHTNGTLAFSGVYQKGKKVKGVEYNIDGQITFEGEYDQDSEY